MGPLLEKKKAWKVAPLCLFWTFWRERNRKVFDNCESMDQTLSCIFFRIGLDCLLGMVL